MLIYIVKGRKMVRERHKIRKMGQRRFWMTPIKNIESFTNYVDKSMY